MRRKLICANWKMNHTLDEGITFLDSLPMENPLASDADVVIFPAFPIINPLLPFAERLGIELGGQNLNENPKGALTGEISASILKSAGASWAIVGHSERREVYGESDEIIAKKVKGGVSERLKIILCVGEKLEIRRTSRELEHVKNQLEADLIGLTSDEMSLVSIAYEPVWAIGTGLAAQPNDAEAMMAFIRDWLNERFGFDISSSTRILYGGSVNASNWRIFDDKPNIDGALIGGASLDPSSFLEIIRTTL